MMKILESVDNVIEERHRWEISTKEEEKDELTRKIIDQVIVYAGSEMAGIFEAAFIEAVDNSFYHGNLGLKDLKDIKKIEERLANENYSRKTISTEFSRINNLAVIRITDQGQGFDYESTIQNENRTSSGLKMINRLMDGVVFNDNGNSIMMFKYI